ncbi:MAG: alpha/beta family hydrolase [Candidatus Eisenbacteria bacterium]
MHRHRELDRLPVPGAGEVSAILDDSDSCTVLYVMAHGAGAGMRHVFLESMAQRLVARDVAVLRYQFPYTEAGGRRPDRPAVLESTTRAAVKLAAEISSLPLIAGGKSMGGRMTSNAQANAPLPGIRGIAFLGFPLHMPKKPSTSRADHLSRVDIPMLFLQGTRDTLADLDLLTPICAQLGPKATLHVVEGADHGFAVLKRSGRTSDEVLDELADRIRTWVDALPSSPDRD